MLLENFIQKMDYYMKVKFVSKIKLKITKTAFGKIIKNKFRHFILKDIKVKNMKNKNPYIATPNNQNIIFKDVKNLGLNIATLRVTQ